MHFKSTVLVLAIGVLLGCSGQDKKEGLAEPSGSEPGENCLAKTHSISAAEVSLNYNYGDGSDGEFYLRHGEIFYLEEKTYNFTNVNLEEGSLLTIASGWIDGTGIIQINSLGICNFWGNIEASGYGGKITINCSGDSSLAAVVSHPDGNVTLSTGDTAQRDGAEGNSVIEFGATLSRASIDITGGELNVREDGITVGTIVFGPSDTSVPQGVVTCSKYNAFVVSCVRLACPATKCSSGDPVSCMRE